MESSERNPLIRKPETPSTWRSTTKELFLISALTLSALVTSHNIFESDLFLSDVASAGGIGIGILLAPCIVLAERYKRFLTFNLLLRFLSPLVMTLIGGAIAGLNIGSLCLQLVLGFSLLNVAFVACAFFAGFKMQYHPSTEEHLQLIMDEMFIHHQIDIDRKAIIPCMMDNFIIRYQGREECVAFSLTYRFTNRLNQHPFFHNLLIVAHVLYLNIVAMIFMDCLRGSFQHVKPDVLASLITLGIMPFAALVRQLMVCVSSRCDFVVRVGLSLIVAAMPVILSPTSSVTRPLTHLIAGLGFFDGAVRLAYRAGVQKNLEGLTLTTTYANPAF